MPRPSKPVIIVLASILALSGLRLATQAAWGEATPLPDPTPLVTSTSTPTNDPTPEDVEEETETVLSQVIAPVTTTSTVAPRETSPVASATPTPVVTATPIPTPAPWQFQPIWPTCGYHVTEYGDVPNEYKQIRPYGPTEHVFVRYLSEVPAGSIADDTTFTGKPMPVYAVTDGEVIRLTLLTTRGYRDGQIAIKSPNGHVINYEHINPNYEVSVGQKVTQGQQIATTYQRGPLQSLYGVILTGYDAANAHLPLRDLMPKTAPQPCE